MVRELLRGISGSLGLDACYLEKASELETGLQMIVANFYPPCPQPEKAMGMPPHTDHGLLAILMENNVGGLQVKYNGKWVHVNPLPNSFIVNIGDQLEVNYKLLISSNLYNIRVGKHFSMEIRLKKCCKYCQSFEKK